MPDPSVEYVQDDEWCVVVGATGAMGTVFTNRLAARGYGVLAVSRTALAHAHPRVVPLAADIADDSSIDAIAARLDGPVRMAVFAAGLPIAGSSETMAPDDLGRAANTKVGGMLRLVRGVRARLVAGSRIVAIAGSLGVEPGPLDAVPGTANAALLNLMRQLSLTYGPHGVTVHTIAPGPVDTPRLQSFVETEAAETDREPAEIWERYLSRTSLGRLPRLDELGWLVETLLSPQADVLHGAVLAADAGVRRGIL